MRVSRWDSAECLGTKEAIVDCLEVALEDNDTDFLVDIVGALPRAQGMIEIAQELDVTRESLCQSLGLTSAPSFFTVPKLLNLLGMRLTVTPAAVPEAQAA
jgi:probable addiction module antidote protein